MIAFEIKFVPKPSAGIYDYIEPQTLILIAIVAAVAGFVWLIMPKGPAKGKITGMPSGFSDRMSEDPWPSGKGPFSKRSSVKPNDWKKPFANGRKFGIWSVTQAKIGPKSERDYPNQARNGQLLDNDPRLDGKADAHNPLHQMEFVSRVEFETVRLLNSEEAPLLPILERIVREIGRGHRVMAQTSLGEILRPKYQTGSQFEQCQAFASINSKRLDFAIFDRYGKLVLAVEYQGSGHYSDKAFVRDAVKREALRKASIHMLEIIGKYDAEAVRGQVLMALGIDLPPITR